MEFISISNLYFSVCMPVSVTLQSVIRDHRSCYNGGFESCLGHKCLPVSCCPVVAETLEGCCLSEQDFETSAVSGDKIWYKTVAPRSIKSRK